MTTKTWVVGSGGMLGSAVAKAFRSARPLQVLEAGKIRWESTQALADLDAELSRFLKFSHGERWQIVWCAGAGVTSTAPGHLQAEFDVFSRFLDLLASRVKGIPERGSLFFASSAGAVYGGSRGAPFNENSETNPLGNYGIFKLQAERKLEDFSRLTSVNVLIGRISNLYGPGQSLAKGQGLISVLGQSTLLRRPTSIFVSLDTLRDYVFVDDCAALIVRSSDRLHDAEGKGHVIRKILGSGRSVTIGSVIGEFKTVTGRRPLIIMGASTNSSLQGRDLRMKSVVWPDLDRTPMTPLVVGIAQTLADLSLRFNVLGAHSSR